MHKSNEDCFYFLTSSCAKGLSCTYRHSPLALTCNVICPAWLRGNCLDPACVFRHSTIQRPMANNGILCFYESTPMGCLKPECTFIHSRPRMNLRNTPTIRPGLTNPIKNDITKPIANNTPAVAVPQPTQTSESNLNPLQSTKSETTSTGVSSNPDTSTPVVKTETVVRRIAIPSDTQLPNDIKDSSATNNNNNPSSTKSTTRSIITDSPKINSEETTTTPPQSRLIVNRNVVIGEPTNVPTRTIVQTAPSSNRVVVSSNNINSPSKGKKNDIDPVEEEIETKKFKSDSQSTVDIPFPCSTSSVSNRLLFMGSKETTSTSDTKPARFNRHRLPATQTSSGNSSQSVSTPSNEEKTSAGTGLSQDNDRRTMRLERFQKKPISPTRSATCSSSITTSSTVTTTSPTTRNVITTSSSSSNERKRTAPETTTKNIPPSKRVSVSPSQRQSSSRQTTSSLNVLTNSSSSVRNKNWEKQTDDFIAKNAQQKNPSPTKSTSSQPASSSSERPRFTPQLITGPSLHASSPPSSSSTTAATSKASRLRQPPSVAIKRPLVPVTASSPTSTKPIVQVSSNTSKSTVEHQPSNTPNEEDENQLLKLNDSADIVDTFALIDEALLEADHLLELM